MSVIEGMKDHPFWHNPDGSHRHPHPSTYHDRKSDWTALERRYAAHLDRHQELIDNPEPMKGDPQAVTNLFVHIETLEKIIAKEKLIIRALRERAAAHPEADELDLSGLTRAIKGGGR